MQLFELDGFESDELDELERHETDSDSDSYDSSVPNSPEQRRAANALRALSSYLAFEIAEDFRSRITTSLIALIKAPADQKAMQAVVSIHQEIKEDPGSTLAFGTSKMKHAAAHALYGLSTHLRLTKTKVNYAKLLQKLLEILAGTRQDLEVRDIHEISLFAYWSGETMKYCEKAETLLKKA